MPFKFSSPLFISFEGVDCVGKSTQVALLSEFLKDYDIDHIVTKEPDDTAFGKFVSHITKSREYDITQEAETLMFIAARDHHLRKVILPAIECGKWVICDRFHDSTLAYQGYGNGVKMQMINQLDFRMPDITIFLEMEFEKMIEKIEHKHDKDKIEEKGRGFFQRVHDGYVEIAKNNATRYRVINADQEISAVAEDIVNAISQWIMDVR